MADFTLWIDDAGADEVAGELERIAGMVREGFTSGDTASAGWWDVKDLAEAETEEAA